MTDSGTTPGMFGDPRAEHPAERLLEESWGKRERKPAHREVLVELTAAGLFLAVAVPLALPAMASHPPAVGLVALLVVLYALVAGVIGFPIGAGYLVPTYLVLVPMLLLLPPGMVPLLAAVGGVVASLGRLVAGRARPGNVLFAIPNAWYAIGPAVVLMAAGTEHGDAVMTGVYLAAFLAGSVIDLVTSTLREAAAQMIAPQIQLRVTGQAWLLDACVAPLGLLLALAARRDHAALLILLPLGALLLQLQRDRDHRIVQAHERLELALTDPLTRLGNRRKLAADLIARINTTSYANPLALMVFDLDGFKAYNDTFGRSAGDALLSRLGKNLGHALEGRGTAYRMGGDEFCVLAPETDLAGTQQLAERVLAAVATVTAGIEALGASAGIAAFPGDGTQAMFLLEAADQRLLESKRSRSRGRRRRAA
jgi:diguanylate cyclase (GGDEF)-like protein